MKRLALVLGIVAAMVAAVTSTPDALAHERKEVAGLVVIFGAEPEPAVSGEKQSLVWRFRDKESEEPFGELSDLEAVVRYQGTEYGPFASRVSRREPGLVQTMHIFTEPGEYEVTLRFVKGDDPTVHSVDFTFSIADRAELEIPGKGG